MPVTFLDAPNAGQPVGGQQDAADEASMAVLARVRVTVLPRLAGEAQDRGWWRPGGGGVPRGSATAGDGEAGPTITTLGPGDLDRLTLAHRTIPPFDAADGHRLLVAAAADGARVVGAVAGTTLVGVAVAAPDTWAGGGSAARDEALLALGVAPAHRRRGLARGLLRALVDGRPAGVAMTAAVGVAERDVVEPLDVEVRRDVARRLLASAGFEPRAVSPDVARDDPWAISGRLAPR
jgi:GNAT superfamily N-acetyltransferase